MARKVFPQFDRIKTLREASGWGQDWVAQAADISKRTYQRIEAGEGCSMETLKSLAAVFEVHFKELLPPPVTPADSSFVPSWRRLLWRAWVLLLWKPIAATVLAMSLLCSALGLSYVVHKAEIVEVRLWMPLTPEEEAELDAFEREINLEAAKEGLPPLVRHRDAPPVPESEEYRVVLQVLGMLIMFIWSLVFIHQAVKLPYQRDFHVLVAERFDRWADRTWQFCVQLISRLLSRLFARPR